MQQRLNWWDFKPGYTVKNKTTGEIGYVVEVWYNNVFVSRSWPSTTGVSRNPGQLEILSTDPPPEPVCQD